MFVGQTLLVFVQRSPLRPIWSGMPPTRMAWWLAAGTLASLGAAIAVPALATALHLAAPSLARILIASALGALSVLWWEPLKREGLAAAFAG